MKKTIALTAALTCAAASQAQAGFLSDYFSYTKTEHPIMLVPGIFAFDTIATIDYWYQIPDAIESRGGEAYVAKINAFDSSVGRGEELIAQLEEIKASSGGRIEKFNLMGHSQGGMTSRYVMETRPDLVASVTTMHTPHNGSPIADLVTDIAPPDTVQGELFETFANAVGDLVNLMSDNEKSDSDVYAMLGEFNAAGSAQYNATYTNGLPLSECGNGPSQVTINGENIKLYSWSGTGLLTSGADISDPLFALTSLAFDSGDDNDGITGRCSSHFGTVLRDDYFMNHLDVNNHVLGLVSLFETNPKTLFKDHANRLKNAGL
ncbi:lipase family alpha/beta hydrolase [Alkalimarinus coralli]|uniref:lipase family alpha/beta hydrolase n=1 Tax=Alkalimarinus coralli TaxID=2935863 RepID=UPI00202B814E|nr:triacylglycerol lipase [Alkalimarinus coralli]